MPGFLARIFGIRKDGRGWGGAGPGFLALEKTAGGGAGPGGSGGGRIFQGKNMKNTVLPLENSNPTNGKYYLLFTIQFPKNPKTYFRYYIILFKNSSK